MVIGDTLVCKAKPEENQTAIYTVNKTYKITEITENRKYDYIVLESDTIRISKTFFFGSFIHRDGNISEYVWDYFYKPHELRSIKLKTII